MNTWMDINITNKRNAIIMYINITNKRKRDNYVH